MIGRYFIKKLFRKEVISVFEKTEKNPVYMDFKKTFKENSEPGYVADDYEWKCYLVKKYFRENLMLYLANVILGILLVTISAFFMERAIVPARFQWIFSVILFVGFFYYIGFGIMASIFYGYMYKHHKDYVWSEEGSLAGKIRRFYS